MNDKGESIDSDHFPLKMEVKLDVAPVKKQKIKMPNFNEKESQLKFKENTSYTNAFTKCFENMQPVLEQSEEWLKHVNTYCKQSFKNIRIRAKKIKPSAADRMIGQGKRLLKQGEIEESKILYAEIAKTISEEGRAKAHMFKKLCDRNQSGVMSEMWNLKKTVFSKKAFSLPSAKINSQGKLVTEPTELTKLLREEYGKVRLRKQPTHPLNLQMKSVRQKLIQLKMKIATKRQTNPSKWKI